jgi:AcrR family transcriptional regulator
MSPAGRPTQTDPRLWVAAALETIEEAGVSALAVESVARRLGVSKGGCYHHFKDRRALLRAALAEWERAHVDDLTARFHEIGEPRERLRRLLEHAVIDLEPTVIGQLMSAASDPDVAAALARAANARIALLERIFLDLGLPKARSRHRATLAYSAYLGLGSLRDQAPDRLSSPRRTRAYLRDLEATLLHDVS